jgi:DNA replication and repair protein RecF
MKKLIVLLATTGSGKTNVLDSIYHLAMTKSCFHSIGSQSINHSSEFMLIEG